MAFPFITTLFFSSGQTGWSEGYTLRTDVEATATTSLATLVDLRLACFVSTGPVQLEYARASRDQTRGDSIPVLNTPAKGTLAPGIIVGAKDLERPEVSHLYRLSATIAKHSMRFLHGIPDIALDGSTYVLGNYPAYDLAVNAFLTGMRDLCALRTIIRVQGQPTTFQYTNYTGVALRGVRTRRVGRPFGLLVGRRPRL